MNPDTIGCVWTGEFDLNTLRVDGDFFESGKKNLRIQKYPDTCGRSLKEYLYFVQKSTLLQGVSPGFFVKNDQILKSEFFTCLCPWGFRRVVKLSWE